MSKLGMPWSAPSPLRSPSSLPLCFCLCLHLSFSHPFCLCLIFFTVCSAPRGEEWFLFAPPETTSCLSLAWRKKGSQGMLTRRSKGGCFANASALLSLKSFHVFKRTCETRKPVFTYFFFFFFFSLSLNCHILQEEGWGESIRAILLCFCTPHSQAWCIACSARGSHLPSQAEIKAGAEQVGKLGLRVEPFRYHMPPFFMPPLTKGYGSKHTLPLLPLSRVQTHTLTHSHTHTHIHTHRHSDAQL